MTKKDRRVEFVFYEKEKPPEIKKIENKNEKISKKLCQIYDVAIALFTVVVPKIIKPEPIKKNINLSIVYPEKTPHKQYVNLENNGKELGAELKIKVKAEGAFDGDKITWKVTAGKNNSTRNDKVPYFKDPESKKKKNIENGEAEIVSKVKEDNAEIVFYCGVAGGDKFNFEISCGNAKIELEMVNHRRFWYELTHQKGLKIPHLDNSK